VTVVNRTADRRFQRCDNQVWGALERPSRRALELDRILQSRSRESSTAFAFSTESFAQEVMAAVLVLFGTAGMSGVSTFETARVVHDYQSVQ